MRETCADPYRDSSALYRLAAGALKAGELSIHHTHRLRILGPILPRTDGRVVLALGHARGGAPRAFVGLCHYYCFAITTALPLIRSHSMEIVADEKGVGRKFRRFFNRELFHCVQGTSGQELARLPTVEP